MALQFDFKFAEHLCLPNVSRNGIASSSAVYSEAPLILIKQFLRRKVAANHAGLLVGLLVLCPWKTCVCSNSESKYEGVQASIAC